jgi:hypothetical protein
MKCNKVRQDERALRLAINLRRRMKKEAGRLKAEVAAEPGQADENNRARKAVVGVVARLHEVISTLEARRSAFYAIAGPAADRKRLAR